MPHPPPQSYLLRLWREHPGAPMRATLVPVARPEAHQHFADLDALCAFLHAQADEEPGGHDAWDTTYCTHRKAVEKENDASYRLESERSTDDNGHPHINHQRNGAMTARNPSSERRALEPTAIVTCNTLRSNQP